jgi:hypothetical protein
MKIENISQDRQTKLMMAIEANASSVRRRNVSYTIYCYSDFMGVITLTVSGKRGSVTKAIAVNFDLLLERWTVFSDGKKYTLDQLSELQAIMKSIVAKETTNAGKI